MKKSLSQWNKDSVTDEKIFNDLSRLSDGKLTVGEDVKLPEVKENYQNRSRNKKRNPKRHNDKK